MINKILVAIDFSDASINALEHALNLAEKAKADIRLVWVNKPESAKEIFETLPDNVTKEVGKRFELLVEKYQASLSEGRIDYKIKEGKIYREIVSEARTWQAGLIIAGTHGASGFEEFWAGSNANKIVSATDLPVITIRGGVDIERDLNTIVMPIDSTPETRQKTKVTAELAAYFDAEVHVLALHTTNISAVRDLVDSYARQVIGFLEDDGIKCRLEKLDAINLTRETIDYAIKVDANLISIMTEQEKTTSNLWLGPYAAQMVNHCPIPVLSIHAV